MENLLIPTDGLNDSERKTVAVIQTALDQMRRNPGIGTRDELKTFIDESVKADKEALAAAQTELTAVKSEAEEMKALTDQLQSQMRRMQANNFATLKGEGGRYHGHFSCPEEAKMFGLLLMGQSLETCKHLPELGAKYARVMKAIEKTGHELVYVKESTGERIQKASTTVSQASGSLLVTSEMVPSLITLFEQYGVFEADAAPLPMGASSAWQPKMDALMTLYCPGEGGAITVTDPTVNGVTLTPRSVLGLIAYSMELDEDSAIALAELYGAWIAASYGYYIDLIGFLGDGTSTYFSMTGVAGAMRAVDSTISSIKGVVVGSGNAYSELVYGDFEAMAGKLPQFADNERTRAYMHKYFYYTVFVRAALAAGTGHAQEVILGSAQRQKQMLGYPVRFTQVMPKAEANSQHVVTLGDLWLGAKFGTRGAMEIAQSDQRYFDQRLIAVRTCRRMAINAHGVGDTSKEGPLIALYTAAS
jgi:HK97 family phage major capsid protein